MRDLDALCQVVMKRIFVAFCNGLSYSTVLPQRLDSNQIIQWEPVLLADFEVDENMCHVLLHRSQQGIHV